MTYPAFETLGIAPDYLLIGANAMHHLLDRCAPTHATYAAPDPLPEPRPTTRTSRRGRAASEYKSAYIGVTTHNERYVPQWGGRAGRITGGHQPCTPEGERAAAVERAQALGLGYLERRDGEREPIVHCNAATQA